MPIYEYYCQPCENKWKELHGADDKGGRCQDCGTYVNKKLPTHTTVNINAQLSTPGQRVEKYIEETRQTVKEQVLEARRDYKP